MTTMMTKPPTVQGVSRLTSCETGASRKVTPSNRKSSTIVSPRNIQRVRTWTDSMIGYTQIDSWSEMLPDVPSSHWQNLSRLKSAAPCPGRILFYTGRGGRVARLPV